jgi:putative ATP-binding cassette transporter
MGYNYYIQVVPVLIVAPMYMAGKIEFGVITQSTIAFSQLLGGFSLIITQFQSISSFAAVATRIDALGHKVRELEDAPPPALQVVDGHDGLRFERVTLDDPEGTTLVRDLDLDIQRGTRLLVTGSQDQAKVAFFRATAGLWDHGSGRIVRPDANRICFLPERPYLPPGTLRDILSAPECTEAPGEPEMFEALQRLDLLGVLERIGGIDVERDWEDLLSLGEQQRFSIARALLIAPDYVMLDRVETALDDDRIEEVIGILDRAGITYVAIARSENLAAHFDRILELGHDGAWTLAPVKAASSLPKAS